MKTFREALADKLRTLLDTKWNNPLWREDEYGGGDTEHGFYSTYELDYDKLSAEIDAFCASFKKETK